MFNDLLRFYSFNQRDIPNSVYIDKYEKGELKKDIMGDFRGHCEICDYENCK